MASPPPVSEKSLHKFVLAGLVRSKGIKGKAGGWRTVAKETSVPFETIRKIASGVIANPRVRNLETLAGYFRANAAKPSTAGNAKRLVRVPGIANRSES